MRARITAAKANRCQSLINSHHINAAGISGAFGRPYDENIEELRQRLSLASSRCAVIRLRDDVVCL